MQPDDLDASVLARLTDDERRELDRLLASDTRPWHPLPGPQMLALESPAQVVGFGGAAGGGKTDLAIGLALTRHLRTGLFRQNGTELQGVVDRIAEVLGTRDGFNGSDRIWRFRRWDGRDAQVELGSFPAPGDVRKYQGRPHDLLVFDEASNMRQEDVRFLMGWLRTTDPQQRCRVLMTFNPPTSAEGRWVVGYFAPWLDRTHPRPAKPGEVRWFAVIDGRDVEVDGPAQVEHNGQRITPQSRTFVPSRVTDNPYLMATGYTATLDALPEPLRSQMRYGDFAAGIEDDPWQVIPTAWVEAAQARWLRPGTLPPMDSVGVDVARGGRDSTVIARRHGWWFDTLVRLPGSQTPDGAAVAGQVVALQRDRAVVHIDVIGVGASPFDILRDAGVQVVGVNVAEAAVSMDSSGRLRFANLRSELWWRMREALDPKANNGIALPPDPMLLADLCAPTWRLKGQTLQVASREEIYERIGRSPDSASALILACIETPKRHVLHDLGIPRRKTLQDYDPYRVM